MNQTQELEVDCAQTLLNQVDVSRRAQQIWSDLAESTRYRDVAYENLAKYNTSLQAARERSEQPYTIEAIEGQVEIAQRLYTIAQSRVENQAKMLKSGMDTVVQETNHLLWLLGGARNGY